MQLLSGGDEFGREIDKLNDVACQAECSERGPWRQG